MNILIGFTRPNDPIIASDLSLDISTAVGSPCEAVVVDQGSITVMGEFISESDRTTIQTAINSYTFVSPLSNEGHIVLGDNTINNVSTSKHGFFPKLPTPTGKFLKDNMTWEAIAGGGDFIKAVDDTDDITEGVVNKFATDAEKTKLANISVTQAVDLDTMESDIAGKAPTTHTHAQADVTDLVTALSGKESSITAGTTTQYFRGDKTFQTLDKTAVGLGNVDNTSDANKPVSTATQTALDLKQNTLVSGTNIKTVNGNSLLGSGNVVVGGINTLKTTANQTINSGAGVFTDITGLTFPVVAGTDYAFFFYITFQSAATTTGWRAGVNCPAGTLDFWATSQTIANGAAGVATHTERHNTARDDMTLLTATISQGVDLAIRIEGRYLCTTNGTFAARFANELAANTQIVVQKGSYGWYF